jgi:hypothetical protein
MKMKDKTKSDRFVSFKIQNFPNSTTPPTRHWLTKMKEKVTSASAVSQTS